MERLKDFRAAFLALPAGCTAAEVNLVNKDVTEIRCEHGEVTGSTASERSMLFLRASGENTGVVYTENLHADPCELIAMAMENASVVAAGSAQPMLQGVRDSHISDSIPASVSELTEKAKAWSRLPGVMECTVKLTVRENLVLNSLGTETVQRQPCYAVTLSVPGKGEDNYRVRECTAHELTALDPEKMLRELERENVLCHEELPFMSLPAGKYDTVISSAMTANIMNTAWQLLAQRCMDNARSPLRPGQVLGSDRLNIVDAAVHPASGYDFTIDCEGVRGPERVQLVTNGVITDTLRTLRHGESTGCAGRADLFTANINTELISVPRNIYIEPGELTPEELVEKLGTGIHLTYSMDEYHSVNIAAGTFAIPCGGVYYENGRAVGRLQQMSLVGSVTALFAGLEAVDNALELRGMWPMYDYCFGGPGMLIRGAEFAM